MLFIRSLMLSEENKMIRQIKYVKNIVANRLVASLPKKYALPLAYYRRFHKKLDITNPRTLNENIQYLMMFRYSGLESRCADKYYVREYIAEKNLEYLLPKLYGHWNDAREIDFETLPNCFVLKATNGCGFNVICKNKEILDQDNTIRYLNKCKRIDFSKKNIEPHYDKKLASIICEEYIDSGEEDILDYKIHCIEGEPVGILVCSQRSKALKLNWFDLSWNERKDYITDKMRGNVKFDRPTKLEEMIDIAKLLSKDFLFVRVDLYNVGDRVIFSELTFTPEAGRMDYYTETAQNELGKYFKNVVK